MAVTERKTGTRRKQSVQSNPNVEAPVVEEKATAPHKFDQSDGIMCRSIKAGAVYMEGNKTNILYEFDGYGDEAEIEYRDLVAAVRSKSSFIFAPYILVENEDFINEFPQLKKFYDEKFTVRELYSVLDLDEKDMIATIKALPSGAIETLKNLASSRVADGSLDSISKVAALDDLFGTNLRIMIS